MKSGNLKIVFHVFLFRELSKKLLSWPFYKQIILGDYKTFCYKIVLMPTSVNFVFSSLTLRWFFVMVGYQVTGAIMTEFLGKSELNQQDTGSSENTTAKSTKAEESKRANVQKTSWTSRTQEAAGNAVKSGANALWGQMYWWWCWWVGGWRYGLLWFGKKSENLTTWFLL